MNKYEKPVVLSLSKEDLENVTMNESKITCGKGIAFTCKSSQNYVCGTEQYAAKNRCTKGNIFTCGKTINHDDDVKDFVKK